MNKKYIVQLEAEQRQMLESMLSGGERVSAQPDACADLVESGSRRARTELDR